MKTLLTFLFAFLLFALPLAAQQPAEDPTQIAIDAVDTLPLSDQWKDLLRRTIRATSEETKKLRKKTPAGQTAKPTVQQIEATLPPACRKCAQCHWKGY